MSVDTSFSGLSGEHRDAYVAVESMLREYGLESLSSTVLEFIQQGYSADTVNIMLQDTDAYKQRFRANESRRQKGLPVLSPAEYLATERAYRQVMSAAGLPIGFYDEPSDFESWLSNDVSPVEVQERVKLASDFVNNLDPGIADTMREWYGTGDMIAYALDRKRATDVLARQVEAARIGDAAKDQGVNVGRGLSERLANEGVTRDQARQGFGAVSALTANAGRLSSIYGGTYTAEDAVEEVFLNDADATEKRRKLASRERAQFGGASAQTRTTLSARKAGQV